MFAGHAGMGVSTLDYNVDSIIVTTMILLKVVIMITFGFIDRNGVFGIR